MNFPDWYAAHVKPQLEETLKNMPVPAREALRTASRQAMAACWNAAVDECARWIAAPSATNESAELMSGATRVSS